MPGAKVNWSLRAVRRFHCGKTAAQQTEDDDHRHQHQGRVRQNQEHGQALDATGYAT